MNWMIWSKRPSNIHEGMAKGFHEFRQTRGHGDAALHKTSLSQTMFR
jgi:hypothetical protein